MLLFLKVVFVLSEECGVNHSFNLFFFLICQYSGLLPSIGIGSSQQLFDRNVS